MPKITLLCGPQGGGKSTYSEGMLSDINARDSVESLVRISQDDQGREGHLKRFNEAISFGYNIVVDRINHTKEQRNRYLKPAREAGYEIEIVVLHVPRSTCFARIMARKNHPTINGFDPNYGGGRAGNIMSELDEEIHRADEAAREYQYKEKQANSALD